MQLPSSVFFLTLLAGVGQPATSGGEAWPVVEQPELKQALENAPVLRTESLGEPARGVNVWERWLVPNPDGKSWDLLQIYFKEYYGPHLALRGRSRHRRGEEAAFARRTSVLSLGTSARLRRQILHCHAITAHLEHGPLCV